MRFVVGLISAIVSWAGCAFLFVPDEEDFGGIGQMVFMVAVGVAWIPLWTWLVMAIWKRPVPERPEADRFVVSPVRRDEDSVPFFVPMGAMVGLVLLVLLAKAVEQDQKYGKTAATLSLAVPPAAIIGGLLGVLAGRLRNRL